jgi:hypothetical protein
MRCVTRAGGVVALVLGVTLLTGVPSASASTDAYTPTAAPSLSGSGAGLVLKAVDCSSAGNCVAVGEDGSAGAIEVETDGVWSAVPLSARTGPGATDLVAVSCPAAGSCVAVGSSGAQAVVMTQHGDSWTGTVVTGDTGLYTSNQGSLASVSCPAAGSCVAVGQAWIHNDTTGFNDSVGLIAELTPQASPGTGSTWSARKAPELYAGAPEDAALNGVSCSASGECRAVGHALGNTADHLRYALVDDEKDHVWAYGAAATPGDSDGGPADLVSISCVGDTFVCMAAGSYSRQSHGTQPMIQTIDASDFAEVTTNLVPPIAAHAQLLATSCATDGTCQSVGVAYNADNNNPQYGYGWNGYIVSHTYGAPAQTSAGVVVSETHSPSDANTIQHNETLTATSCVSGGVCVAVGSYVDTRGYEVGVIDTRQYDSDGNVTTETDVHAPEPADDPSTDDQALLTGASCTDATHCVLVGPYLNDTGSPHSVIETLGGAGAPAPTVTRISPNKGRTSGGAKVTITGTHLTGATGVTFGGSAGRSVHVVSATQGTVITPAHAAGTVDVRVQVGSENSATVTADRFTYVAAPVVTGVSPAKGTHRGGTKVTITGKHLTGATKVEFGSARGSHVKVVSAGKITVTSPQHATGKVDVRVVTAGGTSAKRSADVYRFT